MHQTLDLFRINGPNLEFLSIELRLRSSLLRDLITGFYFIYLQKYHTKKMLLNMPLQRRYSIIFTKYTFNDVEYWNR